jgi:hypothetical protein
MATPSQKLPTGWINIWISLGLVVTLVGLFLPAGMKNHAQAEVQRYQECAAGRRDDCKASLVWVIYEQALKQEGGSGLLLESIKAEASLYQ